MYLELLNLSVLSVVQTAGVRLTPWTGCCSKWFGQSSMNHGKYHLSWTSPFLNSDKLVEVHISFTRFSLTIKVCFRNIDNKGGCFYQEYETSICTCPCMPTTFTYMYPGTLPSYFLRECDNPSPDLKYKITMDLSSNIRYCTYLVNALIV